MDVLITGAGGFLGQMIAHTLAEQGTVLLDGVTRDIARILAADIDPAPLQALAKRHANITPLVGDLSSPATLRTVRNTQPELVIHLAGVVSGTAEADYDLGMRVNLQGTIDLIDVCRSFSIPPVLVFSSSVAVFACDDNETIDDTRQPTPRSSYGAQKLMAEILVRDASRKGFLRGRSLRFPTISVRPGKPNGAASSFASGIIREPLAGQDAVLPVEDGARLHLASPDAAVAAMLHAIGLRQEELEGETTVTLPGISITAGEMIATLARVAGDAVAERVKRDPDPAIAAIVMTWPGQIRTPRAAALGFVADTDFEALVRAHMDHVSEPA